MTRSALAAVAIAAAFGASAAHAAPNLLTNGSFESGFTGWVTAGTGTTPGSFPSTIITDGVTPGPYGDVVAADNAASPSPDAAGTHAVYFVDDNAKETLSQSVTLTGGTRYSVGFDEYATTSGAANPGFFQLTTTLGATTIQSVSDTGVTPVATWLNTTQTFVAPTSGSYTFTFTYTSGPTPSKDVLVDKVFVTQTVPEPMSLAVLGVGLVAAGLVRRRAR